jgi:hypothetical protein
MYDEPERVNVTLAGFAETRTPLLRPLSAGDALRFRGRLEAIPDGPEGEVEAIAFGRAH